MVHDTSRYESCRRQICDSVRERIDLSREVDDAEIQDMIDEEKEIEVNCQFCNSHYKFSPDELKEMLLKAAAK